jgi:hypothetical protein
MTLNQFNKLKETQQFDILSARGAMVAKRKDKRFEFILYQLDDMYIEIKYFKDHKTIPQVKAFYVTDKALLPYLEAINIKGLLFFGRN